eukprot:scaffold3259_cov373-Prasinococcus_capsulatus_cf.AAC.11
MLLGRERLAAVLDRHPVALEQRRPRGPLLGGVRPQPGHPAAPGILWVVGEPLPKVVGVPVRPVAALPDQEVRAHPAPIVVVVVVVVVVAAAAHRLLLYREVPTQTVARAPVAPAVVFLLALAKPAASSIRLLIDATGNGQHGQGAQGGAHDAEHEADRGDNVQQRDALPLAFQVCHPLDAACHHLLVGLHLLLHVVHDYLQRATPRTGLSPSLG